MKTRLRQSIKGFSGDCGRVSGHVWEGLDVGVGLGGRFGQICQDVERCLAYFSGKGLEKRFEDKGIGIRMIM